MKKFGISSFFNRMNYAFLVIILFYGFIATANNPLKSNSLINLSAKVGQNSNYDYQPELVITGNKIHVIWIETESNNYKLYYCRSVDLGKTWENPKLITNFKYPDGNFAYNMSNRKLAVDGENIHIAICDMDFPNGFASKVYYFRSTNGGGSFEPVKELASKGGDGWFTSIQIRAVNGKIAIVYKGTPNAKGGLFSLISTDNGGTFTEKVITSANSNLSDIWFDGTQLIITYEYNSEYSAFAAISNNYGSSYSTVRLTDEKGSVKQARSKVDGHYSHRIAKLGNSIHIIYNSQNSNGQWTVMYALSTDNGLTFKQVVDVNNGLISTDEIAYGHESVVVKGNYVYLAYLGKNSMIYLATSSDNGSTVTPAKNILPTGFSYTGGTWYPGLTLDPTDATGATLYAYGNAMFSTKTTDGGKTFSQDMAVTPFLGYIRHITADLVIDTFGSKHWIAQAQWWEGSDYDIFYRNVVPQPEPGIINKALSISTVNNGNPELTIVPSSKSLDFESALTAEAWVKVDVASIDENYDLGIFAKVNGTDDSNPNGFQICMRKKFGKMVMNPGIETDKGDFIDPFDWSGESGFADTLWHHIAITYDANAGADNFKTYIDGLLNDKQTVTGKLKQGNGLFMIGARNNYKWTSNFKIDDIRLWNRALTQDELLTNQTKKLKGNEPGLKLFLNFDDTFKDISGNGNDAIPLYLYKLKISDFNPPIPEFDLYQSMNQLSLTNKTQNGKDYKWSFGDGITSTKGNPVYTYPKAGEYKLTLEATNENSKTAIIKKASIAGLQKIEPSVAGNGGFASFIVYGGGINSKTTAKLVKENEVILADSVVFIRDGELNLTFNLNGKAIGKWNVVVNINGVDYTLKDALTIEPVDNTDPYVVVNGRGAVLSNRWQVQNIEVINSGNIDKNNVPIIIAISNVPGIEVEFVNVDIVLSSFSEKLGHSSFKNVYPIYYIKKDYFNESNGTSGAGKDAKIFPLLIETLPQNSSIKIALRVKSAQSYELVAWTYGFSGSSILKSASYDKRKDPFGACMWETATNTLTNAVFDGLDLLKGAFPIGCAKASYDAMSNAYKTAKNGNPQVRSTLWDLASIAVNCGAYLSGAGPAYEAASSLASIIMTGVGAAYDAKRCWDKFAPARLKTMIANSFDPNEMIGPSGFGTQHWIQKTDAIPYTVLFENKSVATAPAHEVFITDSLDLNKFVLKEFGFGSFGFGDTTIVPKGNKLKQFSMDIDLRPKKNLITRVSGKLDTIKGIIHWEFLSLNPVSMEYEEDPFVGFLPPNNDKRAGEGFVSFSVGLKKDLATNATLKNKASIVFDANKPIVTNEYVNILDLDKPQSQVYPLDATIDSRFPLAWTGSDIGSGIASYSVYVMENDTDLKPWKLNTTLKTDEFIGKVGSKYKFYSVATDNVSLLESAPSQYDASTHITVDVKEFELRKDELQVFPNPVKDKLNISMQNAPCGMYVVELVNINGQTCYSEIHDDFSISKGIQIDVNNLNSGNYMIRIVYGNKLVTRKIMIR